MCIQVCYSQRAGLATYLEVGFSTSYCLLTFGHVGGPVYFIFYSLDLWVWNNWAANRIGESCCFGMCVCACVYFLVKNSFSCWYTARKSISLQLISFTEAAGVNWGPYRNRQWAFEPGACSRFLLMIFDVSLEFCLQTYQERKKEGISRMFIVT